MTTSQDSEEYILLPALASVSRGAGRVKSRTSPIEELGKS